MSGHHLRSPAEQESPSQISQACVFSFLAYRNPGCDGMTTTRPLLIPACHSVLNPFLVAKRDTEIHISYIASLANQTSGCSNLPKYNQTARRTKTRSERAGFWCPSSMVHLTGKIPLLQCAGGSTHGSTKPKEGTPHPFTLSVWMVGPRVIIPNIYQ